MFLELKRLVEGIYLTRNGNVAIVKRIYIMNKRFLHRGAIKHDTLEIYYLWAWDLEGTSLDGKTQWDLIKRAQL